MFLVSYCFWKHGVLQVSSFLFRKSELYLEPHVRRLKEDLVLFTDWSRPAFLNDQYPQIEMNPTPHTWTSVSVQQSPTEGNGTSGDSPSLWTNSRNSGPQGSFRNSDELQSHWASSSTGVTTIMVHIVSFLAAACLNFHYPEPDERSWDVSPGRRVSSDVVTLVLSLLPAPRSPHC